MLNPGTCNDLMMDSLSSPRTNKWQISVQGLGEIVLRFVCTPVHVVKL